MKPITKQKQYLPPTIKQAEVYEIWNRLSYTTTVYPSVRQIAKEMGVSSSATVHMHLKALREKGWI